MCAWRISVPGVSGLLCPLVKSFLSNTPNDVDQGLDWRNFVWIVKTETYPSLYSILMLLTCCFGSYDVAPSSTSFSTSRTRRLAPFYSYLCTFFSSIIIIILSYYLIFYHWWHPLFCHSFLSISVLLQTIHFIHLGFKDHTTKSTLPFLPLVLTTQPSIWTSKTVDRVSKVGWSSCCYEPDCWSM